jgi:Protein of unknown function (DUF3761)/Glucodextranase, domain B
MDRAKFAALMRSRWSTRTILSCFAIAIGCSLCACGSGTGSTTSAQTNNASTPPTASVAPIALHLNEGSYSLSARSTTINGSVTRGASVTINGRAVQVHSGRWQRTLALHLGSNVIAVSASMGGRQPANKSIRITRQRSGAELEALAQARALRAEAIKRKAAEAAERKAEAEKQKAETETQKAAETTASCTNGTYVNAAGNTVCRPEQSPTVPAGATAKCEDGTYSFSESRSGTCSHHGGVAEWLSGEE